MRTRSAVAAVLVGAALAFGSALPAAALPTGSPASGGDGTRRVALGDSWAAGTAAGEPGGEITRATTEVDHIHARNGRWQGTDAGVGHVQLAPARGLLRPGAWCPFGVLGGLAVPFDAVAPDVFGHFGMHQLAQSIRPVGG